MAKSNHPAQMGYCRDLNLSSEVHLEHCLSQLEQNDCHVQHCSSVKVLLCSFSDIQIGGKAYLRVRALTDLLEVFLEFLFSVRIFLFL